MTHVFQDTNARANHIQLLVLGPYQQLSAKQQTRSWVLNVQHTKSWADRVTSYPGYIHKHTLSCIHAQNTLSLMYTHTHTWYTHIHTHAHLLLLQRVIHIVLIGSLHLCVQSSVAILRSTWPIGWQQTLHKKKKKDSKVSQLCLQSQSDVNLVLFQILCKISIFFYFETDIFCHKVTYCLVCYT